MKNDISSNKTLMISGRLISPWSLFLTQVTEIHGIKLILKSQQRDSETILTYESDALGTVINIQD